MLHEGKPSMNKTLKRLHIGGPTPRASPIVSRVINRAASNCSRTAANRPKPGRVGSAVTRSSPKFPSTGWVRATINRSSGVRRCSGTCRPSASVASCSVRWPSHPLLFYSGKVLRPFADQHPVCQRNCSRRRRFGGNRSHNFGRHCDEHAVIQCKLV